MAGERRSSNELTIGELASMCRLTVRALRHYDHIGLLHPARVDPDSGYRYYDTGQVVSASMIAVLRRLDVDVRSIAALLDGSVDLDGLIAAERAHRERAARRAAASLAVLESFGAALPRPAPLIESTPDRALLGHSIDVMSGDEVSTTAAAFEQLFALAHDAGIAFDPNAICIVRVSSREQLRLDIGVVVDPAITDTPPGLRRFDLAGGTVATVVHHGPLESLPVGHGRLHGWLLEHGTQVIGAAREIYLGALSEQRTRIEIPVIDRG